MNKKQVKKEPNHDSPSSCLLGLSAITDLLTYQTYLDWKFWCVVICIMPHDFLHINEIRMFRGPDRAICVCVRLFDMAHYECWSTNEMEIHTLLHFMFVVFFYLFSHYAKTLRKTNINSMAVISLFEKCMLPHCKSNHFFLCLLKTSLRLIKKVYTFIFYCSRCSSSSIAAMGNWSVQRDKHRVVIKVLNWTTFTTIQYKSMKFP